MIVTQEQYLQEFKAFFKKHGNDFNVFTSQMNSAGCWYKTYAFADGAQWHENYSPEYEDGIAEVKGVKVQLKGIKLLRTEFYSTETPSKYMYEAY